MPGGKDQEDWIGRVLFGGARPPGVQPGPARAASPGPAAPSSTNAATGEALNALQDMLAQLHERVRAGLNAADFSKPAVLGGGQTSGTLVNPNFQDLTALGELLSGIHAGACQKVDLTAYATLPQLADATGNAGKVSATEFYLQDLEFTLSRVFAEPAGTVNVAAFASLGA